MSKMASIKISKEAILKICLLALPIFDALNGFMIRQRDFYGIGSAYHLFLLVVIILLQLNKTIQTLGKFEKITIGFILIFTISIFLNYLFNGLYENISGERVLKILSTALFICGIYRLVNNEIISKKQFYKIIRFQCTIVPIMTIISNLSGINNYAYPIARSGRIGFYSNLNEATVIFAIICLCLLKEIYCEIKITTLVLFFITEGCLIFTESKTGYISAAFFLALFVVHWLVKRRKKITVVAFLLLVILVPIGLYLVHSVVSKTLESFLFRQNYLAEAYLDNSPLSFLTSGRTDRFSQFLKPIYENLTTSNPINVLIGAIQIMIGQGLRFGYLETFEMDMFDCLLYGGVVVSIMYLLFNFAILKKTLKVQKDRFNFVGICFIILASFFIGHVWTGGVGGVYFAMFATYFMCYPNVNIDTEVY